jgi:hypothetical protein
MTCVGRVELTDWLARRQYVRKEAKDRLHIQWKAVGE